MVKREALMASMGREEFRIERQMVMRMVIVQVRGMLLYWKL
jgi:hypothetical protein